MKFIKIIFTILVLLGGFSVAQNSEAAINKQFNYQGKLTNSSGVAVPDTAHGIKFVIYDAASSGNCLWTARGNCGTPTARDITPSSGLFSVMLGDTVAGDNAIDLSFNTDSYYLGITVGSDLEMTPRKRIGAVPQAWNANNVVGDGYIDIDNTSISQDVFNINYNPASGTYSATSITYGSGGGTGNALTVTQSGTGAIVNLANTSSATADAFTLTNLGSGNSFIVNDSTTDTSPFIIDASGNVGIGTTSLSGAKFKIALGSRSVSDTYDDQSKIASLSNATLSSGKLQISEAICGTYTVQDADSNSYNTVLIGAQCWLKQNLRTGTQLATGNTTPSNNGIIEKWCPAPSGTAGTVDNLQYAANCVTDGGLYQWNEAMGYITTPGAQGICPSGWHIPTDAEQYILENYLKDGANSCVSTRTGWDCDTAGTKLKVGGTSGFEGILAGYRGTGGSFNDRLTNTNFWSSSQYDASNAWRRHLDSGYSTVYRDYYNKAYGFSVRCLKD